jgi:prepilin-type N-terminal cleavage/methylation domain-containing protein
MRASSSQSAIGNRQSAIRAFTLIEILVTLLLIGIVIPAIMHAITAAAAAGSSARHRNDAAAMANSQLATIILAVTQGQTPNLTGELDQDGFNYSWQATVTPWNQDTSSMGIQDIDLTMKWTEGGRNESMTVSSLAYNREGT